MAVTFEKLIHDIREGKFSPVYFLMGEEPFFIDVVCNFLESKVLGEEEKEFNFSVFYGKDAIMPEIISAARRFPMMARYNLVLVREAQNLKNLSPRGDDESFNAEYEALIRYVEKPLNTTILVFSHKYKTIDGRRKLAKLISEKGILFESKRVYDDKLPEWIDRYVRGKGYAINQQAARILADYLGADLSKVTNEIQKMFLDIEKGQEITPQIIEEKIGISKDFNVFELQKALGTLDHPKAFRIAKYFGANQKANPLVMTVALLQQYFTKLMVYHYSPDRTEKGLAAALGVHPFLLKDYHPCAKNFPPSRLEKVFSHLLECDLKSKGVGVASTDQGELLVELVFKILY